MDDRTPRDAKQVGEMRLRRLDVGDDDADVVQLTEDRHGRSLRSFARGSSRRPRQMQAQYRSALKGEVCRGKWRCCAQGDLVPAGIKNRWTAELNKFVTKVLELARVWRAASQNSRNGVKSVPIRFFGPIAGAPEWQGINQHSLIQ